MRKILQNPLLVPLIATAAILLVLFFGKNHERAGLSYFLRVTVPTPHFLQPGSAEDGIAWYVRSISDKARDGELVAPSVVLLEDDAAGVFQSSPHAPIDLALIARNMKQIGGETLAVGAVMAWDDPDVMGLAALARALESFESVVTTVPLARGATAELIPPTFRRASLPIDAVMGDVSGLPVVNRQAVPDSLLGGDNAISGFTFLEANDDAEQPYLIARWEDRVVFSFPFLVAMRQAGLSVESLRIHINSHIRVGTGGWIIPIDEAGRMMVRASPADWPTISAEGLLDVDTEPFAASDGAGMWLLCDTRSALDGVSRSHSARLVPLVKTLATGAALTEPKELRGVPDMLGWVLLGSVVVLLGSVCRYSAAAMQIGLIFTLVGLVALQWVSLWAAALWMPAMPAILAANVIWVLSFPVILLRRKARIQAVA